MARDGSLRLIADQPTDRPSTAHNGQIAVSVTAGLREKRLATAHPSFEYMFLLWRGSAGGPRAGSSYACGHRPAAEGSGWGFHVAAVGHGTKRGRSSTA